MNTVTRLHSAVPDIPIVVLTGLDDRGVALQAVAQGAQDYLVKGKITAELLDRTIRYAIEREYTARLLRHSEERYRKLVELSPYAILISQQGKIVFANRVALNLLGVNDRLELIYTGISDRIVPAHGESILLSIEKSIADGVEIEPIEAKFRKLDGTEIDGEIATALLTYNGNTALQIVIWDISDRKRAESQILQALERERELNQLKSMFISMVSHEFRNPLTAIKMSSQMLQDTNLPETRKAKRYEVIDNSINRMLQLLDEILFLGRTEADRFQLVPQSLNLVEFCNELIEAIELSTTSECRIIFTRDSESILAEMDALLLQRILTNLLTNAIKYSPQGSNVDLDLICHPDTVTFQIRDRGLGIPLDEQQHLFEPFYRASNVGAVEGTGLGLAIVKKCVDIQAGEIQFTSQEGVGTTFTITLPLHQS
ncbi:MAG: PAS domain S-box protein [Pseudanabaena sp. CRU_2_10]|nr:PAS domain S-box protein [Pseudanabaena sp. CRU_2_10]